MTFPVSDLSRKPRRLRRAPQPLLFVFEKSFKSNHKIESFLPTVGRRGGLGHGGGS